METIWQLVKILVMIIAGFYFLFSLIIVRQVQLMTEVLITEVSPIIRAFSLLHAGFALVVLILFIGYLF